jgi:hypothetical protein
LLARSPWHLPAELYREYRGKRIFKFEKKLDYWCPLSSFYLSLCSR